MSPHRSRYWLHAKIDDPEEAERQIENVCQTYFDAAENEAKGIHTICTDEKSGIQALERAAPTMAMSSGQSERIEYNYERHGTTNLFGNLNVATGKIVVPMLKATRTSEDFADNIDSIVSTDPAAGWIFVCDNLNTHMSVLLVLLVAKLCGIPLDTLGKERKYGVLKSMKTRKAFLEDTSHRLRFVYPPKHCSWLNQIEIWFSGLSRRVLHRGNFDSVQTLEKKIGNYINFYNQTAKPMKWKCKGLPKKYLIKSI